ncbi:MAG: PEP-CTERM sorting domain-containing protein [Verrucomicrobiota bacterium]
MNIKHNILVSLTTMALAAHGQVTVNFDNTVPSGNFTAWSNPYIESGFSFTAQNTGNIDFLNSTVFGLESYNNTDFVNSQGDVITIVKQAGGEFAFDSVAIGENNTTGRNISILGYIGVTQVASLSYTTTAGGAFSGPASWSLVDLPSGFSDVDKVTISLGTMSYSAGFDNFTFSPVPEPSTLALTALAGAGLLLFRRRRV